MGMDPYAAQMGYGGDAYAAYAGYGGMMAGQNQFGAAPSYGASADPVANPGGGVTYTLHIPDAAVSAIVGRSGIVIKEMMQQSGEFLAHSAVKVHRKPLSRT
jgi:hypothetical protein